MNSDIIEAFYEMVTASASGAGLIAYEGIKYTPPESGQWVEIKHFPNTGVDQSLNSNDVLAQGLFQVNVCNRPNTGILPLYGLAELIIGQLPKSTVITGLVRVSRAPYTSSMISLDDRIILPLTVSYSE